jgi:hypothetical protein
MLSHYNRLLFPRLRHLGEAKLEHPSGKHGHTRGLFQLDWQGCDAIKLDDHIKWVRDQHPDKDLPFVNTLPPIIDETVKNQFFALDEQYLNSIRSHSQAARDIWGARYSMDTMARDRAMQPAEALVHSALWLLADCAYDPEAKYYIRTPTKIILPHAMAWKFWQYQTGRGLLWRKARLYDLEDRVEGSPDVIEMTEGFISRMMEHQDELYAAYGALSVDKGAVEPGNKGCTCGPNDGCSLCTGQVKVG